MCDNFHLFLNTAQAAEPDKLQTASLGLLPKIKAGMIRITVMLQKL